MAMVASMSHLMTQDTTSAQVQNEIDTLQSHVKRLTELREQYSKEEIAGTRKP